MGSGDYQRMTLKLRVQDLDVFKALSEDDQAAVIKEYKKGYHALLLYGKLFVFIIAVMGAEYLNGELKSLFWVYRYLVYAVLGYFFFMIVDLIELNFVAGKVIKDLARDLHDY